MTGARTGAHRRTHINDYNCLGAINVNELLKQPA
jgi:hypothetical protein